MNIVLIGYRGTGKSKVAAKIAQLTGKKVVSSDSMIEQTTQMTIPEIVQKQGWNRFRDIESAQIKKLAELNNIIIDTGGGAILRKENVAELKKNGTLYWLKANTEVIATRIKNSTNRPALTEGKTFTEEIEEVLKERTPLYQNAADVQIDTDNLTIEEVAQIIIKNE
jgi:shikimate kinase